MDARLQQRVQRYGWDLAARTYEGLWQTQLAGAQADMLALADLRQGESVLDVACGTGLVTLKAAHTVGAPGRVLGIDLSGLMVDAAAARALKSRLQNVCFSRMDAQNLALPDAGFDVVVCALGLMYMPDPEQALREMRRVLRPGGRLALAVWGERSLCGWSSVFPIVDAEVASDVCPLFFRLGQPCSLVNLCIKTGFGELTQRRNAASLVYADADDACDAALMGGPVALAWSRFGDDVRTRVRRRYLESLAPWRCAKGYRVPAEFVIVSAVAPG